MRKYHLLGLVAAALLAAACGGGSTSTQDGNNGGDGGTIDAPPGTPDAAPTADAAPVVCSATPVAGEPALGRQPVPSDGTTFDTPVWVGSPPGDSRLFVIEQHTGRIMIIKGDAVLGTPFLDVNGLATGNEQGLLGLAFHPGFASNGRFFVNYTDNSGGDTNVVEYHAAPGADVADAAPVRTIIVIDQPFSNHNGGNVTFGPDGFLYIGMGDGGSADDPMGNGQNTNVLLGKMLRLDVDGAAPYAIPPGNPFAGGGGAPEIFSYGLRNPWRWSFDRANGDLYIADVGQNQYEEVDFTAAGTGAGLNYGWNEMEGAHCFGGPGCNMTGLVLPVQEYQHSGGACSITGGFAYRGCRMPGRHGRYFFADYCTGDVTSFVIAGGAATSVTQEAGLSGGNISSFGQDAEGELYIVDLNGGIFKIVPM